MSRPLSEGETALARGVFGDALDHGPVRLSTRRWGVFAIAFGPHISFPPSHPAPDDFTRAPLEMQAWLIHELVHVWQFQTAPMRTLASWALTAIRGGYRRGLPGYRYGWPLKPWAALNLEQQARIVEHAFLLRETGRCLGAPPGATWRGLLAHTPFAEAATGNPADRRTAEHRPAAWDSRRSGPA